MTICPCNGCLFLPEQLEHKVWCYTGLNNLTEAVSSEAVHDLKCSIMKMVGGVGYSKLGELSWAVHHNQQCLYESVDA